MTNVVNLVDDHEEKFAKRVGKLTKAFRDKGAHPYEVACALVHEAKGVLVQDGETEEQARQWIATMLAPRL
jgi:hypothetical protein